MENRHVFEIQRLYPQIYLSCHVDHVRTTSTNWKLSSQDASVLAHLDVDQPTSPASLAAHLGVVPSTLSAVIKRLTQLGYLANVPTKEDKRKREIRLTAKGAEAMASTSVLDREKVSVLLSKLSEAEVNIALTGLGLLAQAAREMAEVRG